MAACITAVAFLFGKYFGNRFFWVEGSFLQKVLVGLTFFIICILILLVSYRIFSSIENKEGTQAAFCATFVSLNTFLLGGLFINENLMLGKFSDLDYVRISGNGIFLAGCVLLFFCILLFPTSLFVFRYAVQRARLEGTLAHY